MDNINKQALAAASDEAKLNEFINSQYSFILSCAGKHSGRFISKEDDEFSVALYAFYEATCKYNESVGDFLPFAAMVIKRRLTDHYRTQKRFSEEHATSPDVFSGNLDEDSSDTIQYEVQEKLVSNTELSAAYEIEAVTTEFAEFGFTFMDLADVSPRAAKTKNQCKDAVSCILSSPVLLDSIKNLHTFPVKALSEQSGVNKKTIERHRKYIIAGVIILTGDYPILAEYMKHLKKGGMA